MTPGDPPRPRGDEADLFERYYERLRRATMRTVNTTAENIEDACTFAFMTMIRNQPERDTVFAWLKVVARREAIRLDQNERAQGLPLDDDFDELVPDGRDPIAAREILLETHALLAPLGDREKAAVLLRGLGWSYEDAARRLGVSDTRLNQLLRRAGERIREHQREIAPDRHAHPRALLLEELQRDPPPFLRAAIGRAPTASCKTGGAERRLEWSRLALSIVDYRVTYGVTDPARPFGDGDAVARSDDRDALEQRIIDFNERRRQRERERGIER